jgi:hypothetical protein
VVWCGVVWCGVVWCGVAAAAAACVATIHPFTVVYPSTPCLTWPPLPCLPACPGLSPLLPCSFTDIVGTIDQLLASGEEATVAPPAPGGSLGPCKTAADLAAAASAIATPRQ